MFAVIKQSSECTTVAFLFDLHRPAAVVSTSSVLSTNGVTVPFTEIILPGLFWPVIELSPSAHVTPLFSAPESDSFPKGQLEVQSSHTQCV